MFHQMENIGSNFVPRQIPAHFSLFVYKQSQWAKPQFSIVCRNAKRSTKPETQARTAKKGLHASNDQSSRVDSNLPSFGSLTLLVLLALSLSRFASLRRCIACVSPLPRVVTEPAEVCQKRCPTPPPPPWLPTPPLDRASLPRIPEARGAGGGMANWEALMYLYREGMGPRTQWHHRMEPRCTVDHSSGLRWETETFTFQVLEAQTPRGRQCALTTARQSK